MTEPQDHPSLRPIPRATAERVWRRAIELQDERGEIVSPDTLLHVARELGVDPVYVEIAMDEVRRADGDADRGRAAGGMALPRPAEDRSGSSPRVRHIERRSSHLPPGDWWTEAPSPPPARSRLVTVLTVYGGLFTAGAVFAWGGFWAALVAGIAAGAFVLGVHAIGRKIFPRGR